jgi:Glutaminase
MGLLRIGMPDTIGPADPGRRAEPGQRLASQCSVRVSARDLAVMGATLANGGVNPVTGEQAIETRYCKRVLAVLATAGLYEQSGEWLYDVGLPGKSGVARGIVTVSPGKGGLGTFSPPLDAGSPAFSAPARLLPGRGAQLPGPAHYRCITRYGRSRRAADLPSPAFGAEDPRVTFT